MAISAPESAVRQRVCAPYYVYAEIVLEGSEVFEGNCVTDGVIRAYLHC